MKARTPKVYQEDEDGAISRFTPINPSGSTPRQKRSVSARENTVLLATPTPSLPVHAKRSLKRGRAISGEVKRNTRSQVQFGTLDLVITKSSPSATQQYLDCGSSFPQLPGPLPERNTQVQAHPYHTPVATVGPILSLPRGTLPAADSELLQRLFGPECLERCNDFDIFDEVLVPNSQDEEADNREWKGQSKVPIAVLPNGHEVGASESPNGITYSPSGTYEQINDHDNWWMEEFVNLPGDGSGDTIVTEEFSNMTADSSLTGQSTPATTALKSFDSMVETNDDYSLNSSDEEEMASLMIETPRIEAQVLPSTAVRVVEIDSQLDLEFASTLRHSLSRPGSEPATNRNITCVDLLSDDVDWDAVMEGVKDPPKDSSAVALSQTTSPPGPETRSESHEAGPNSESSLSARMPFARPPFPAKIQDRSQVIGLSSTVMTRTCFRIGELLNANSKCNNDMQPAIFELFARVTHSNREIMTKSQHFQFRDMFKEQRPYPTGVLRGWKADSLTDQQSRGFLECKGKTRMCRCICRMERDKAARIGWSLIILTIRETTWEEIEWVLRIIRRDGMPAEGSSQTI